MQMRAATVGVTMLAMTAASAYGFEPYNMALDDIELVKAALVAILKDPESAKFGAFAAAKEDDRTIMVCGTVNARNSFGGYSGAAPFVGEINMLNNTFDVQQLAPTDAEIAQVMVRCQNAGAMPAL